MGNKTIVVGLGNPGKEYENTYHNAGLLALERLMANDKRLTTNDGRLKTYKNLFEYVETDTAIFVRPLTYMNDSGTAVRAALKKFAPSTSSVNLVVIHDDSDITVGNFKISFARNSAGHKGVQSIIDAVHTNAFTRIRIGIRPVRESRRQKAGEFALKKITPGDQKKLNEVFKAIVAY